MEMISKVLDRLGMYAHGTTDRDPAGNVEGWRAYLHGRRERFTARLQVSLTPSAPGVAFAANEEGIRAHAVLPRLGVYVGVDGDVTRPLVRLLGADWTKGQRPANDRELSLRFHDGAVWWSLWMSAMDWHSTDPRWRRGSWRPVQSGLDALLGKHVTTHVDSAPEAVEIPLPEGPRPAKITWRTYTSKRPRAPFATHWRSAHVEPSKPVGVPGKGENSWDCGDDAVHSLRTPARDNEEAIAAFVENVLRTRRRYGGSHRFEPSETAVA